MHDESLIYVGDAVKAAGRAVKEKAARPTLPAAVRQRDDGTEVASVE